MTERQWCTCTLVLYLHFPEPLRDTNIRVSRYLLSILQFERAPSEHLLELCNDAINISRLTRVVSKGQYTWWTIFSLKVTSFPPGILKVTDASFFFSILCILLYTFCFFSRYVFSFLFFHTMYFFFFIASRS